MRMSDLPMLSRFCGHFEYINFKYVFVSQYVFPPKCPGNFAIIIGRVCGIKRVKSRVLPLHPYLGWVSYFRRLYGAAARVDV